MRLVLKITTTTLLLVCSGAFVRPRILGGKPHNVAGEQEKLTGTRSELVAIGQRNFAKCKCGQGGPTGGSHRIVGGVVSELGAWPWLATIFKEKHQWCGGALINDQWVLTAAHCIKKNSVNKIRLRLGDFNLATHLDTVHQDLKIAAILLHKGFDLNDGFEDDMALIKLKVPLALDQPDSFVPLCLPSDPSNLYVNLHSVVAGWGAVKEQGKGVRKMREAEVETMSNKACLALGGYHDDEILDSMICASSLKVDSCQGDSGGPLIYQTPQGNYEQIGVVSYGIGCARKKFPGVYTRVTSFLPWIMEVTQGATWCPH